MAVNVGETVVAAAVSVRESLVIEAHQVQDGRVQVVDVDLVFHGVPTEVVGGPVDVPGPHPASSDPHGEPERMVLAPVVSLRGWGAPEFPAPEDQGIVQ